MKKNYRQQNNNSKVLIGIIAAFLLGIAVLVFGFAQKPLGNLFSPLLSFSVNFTEGGENLLQTFRSKAELSEKIKELEHENSRLLLLNRDRDLIHAENKELKERLGRKDVDLSLILARVTSKPPVSPFDIITIDMGKSHGIKKGDKVFFSETTEIGYVDNVFDKHSIVTLYSSAKERTPVEINNGGALVIAEGEGGGAFTIQAPRTLEVVKGDTLSRPSLGSTTIGIVESAEIGETDSFMTIHAKLPINIFEISWVYVQTSQEE